MGALGVVVTRQHLAKYFREKRERGGVQTQEKTYGRELKARLSPTQQKRIGNY